MQPDQRSSMVSDIFCALNVGYDESLWSTLSSMPDEYLLRFHELLVQFAGDNSDLYEKTPETSIIADVWDYLDHFEDDDKTFRLVGFFETARVINAFKDYFNPAVSFDVWLKLDRATENLERHLPLDDFKTHGPGYVMDYLVTATMGDTPRSLSEDEKEHLRWLTDHAAELIPFIPELAARKSTDKKFCEALLSGGHRTLAAGTL